jgi:fumarylacetoacetase
MAQPTGSWISVPEASDFSIQNIPFGVVCIGGSVDDPRVATIIGDTVVDLRALSRAGLLPSELNEAFQSTALNVFMSLGRKAWKDARRCIQALLADSSFDGADERLRSNAELQGAALHPVSMIAPQLPACIGDYTDFYSSREHATNVGIMFRGVANALQPNWYETQGEPTVLMCTYGMLVAGCIFRLDIMADPPLSW